METLLREIRHALRIQLRDRRYAAIVVLTLAVCLGANTALFTVVHSVLLKPLPVPESGRIVLLSNRYPKAGAGDSDFSAAGDYYDRGKHVPALAESAMVQYSSETLDNNGIPEQVRGMAVTPSLLPLLRVTPALGRAFTEADGEPGAAAKVILSHALWHSLFGGDPGAVGRDVRFNGRPYTVVGVMPAGFRFISAEVRFWIPLAFSPEMRETYHSNNWYHVGRMAPGATIERVQAQVDALNRANLDRFPQWRELLRNAGFHTHVRPLQELLVGKVRSTLYLLWAAAGLVLLIGGVNVTSIVLARTNGRMRELGTRLALGAPRGRIAGQLVLENLVLALAGGVAGIVLAALLLRGLGAIGLEQFPRLDEIRIDPTVIAFAAGLAAVSGAALAVMPLVYAGRFQLAEIVNEGGRSGGGGVRSRHLRRGLVVAQVGLAFVLLTGAGLLIASFRELLRVDPGYQTGRVITAATTVPESRYKDPHALRALMDRSLEALRRIPGVEAAGATTSLPLDTGYNDSVILAEGYAMQPGESLISPVNMRITPGYLESLGIGVVRGRGFTAADRDGTQKVILVDERLAKKFWGAADPVGRRMYLPNNIRDLLRIDEKTEWFTVIGVVRQVRLQNLAGTGNPTGVYYFPYAQRPARGYSFAVRTAGDPSAMTAAIRRTLAAIDPTLALFDIRTMEARTQLSLASRRAAMSLAAGFAGIALFLSAVGIYGVLSYLQTQRRREIGIRMAVGGTRERIFTMFLGEGAALVSGGLALGLLGTVLLRRAVEAEVYGVHPLDPGLLALVAALLGAVALTASAWPARRAAAVDPVDALRDQ